LSLDGAQPIAHKELADLLFDAGAYQSAVTHYEEALRLQPDFVEAKEQLEFARSFLRK